MQVPVRIRNLDRKTISFDLNFEKGCQTYSIGTQLRIFVFKGPGLGTRDVDHTIDNSMGHMDALRAEFTGERLCQSTKCKFSRSKCCELG